MIKHQSRLKKIYLHGTNNLLENQNPVFIYTLKGLCAFDEVREVI
jgi:hypothetical protein